MDIRDVLACLINYVQEFPVEILVVNLICTLYPAPLSSLAQLHIIISNMMICYLKFSLSAITF